MSSNSLRILVLTVAAALTACVTQPTSIFPGEGWSYADDAEKAGVDELALRKLSAAVEAASTHSMVVVKGGSIIFDYGDIAHTEDAYVASVRKSVLSMMYGDWVRRGTIDIDATLAELGVDDREGLSDPEKEATVRHLITASSGVYHPASNFSGVTADAPVRGDHSPGEYFWYNNWDFNTAGRIFEELTQENIYEAFNEQLANPIQLQDFDLALHLKDGKSGNLDSSVAPAYHFFLSTRDLARLGLLMLRGGEWDGQQVIPADWVVESTSIVIPNGKMNPQEYRDSGFGYGYMWWVFDPEKFPEEFHGGYAARGHFGQYIVVLPAVDVVIAHKTLGENYETPEEYAAMNVTWDELRVLIDLSLEAL